MNWIKTMALIAALALSLGLAACDSNDGPAEKAGEKIDKAVEKAGEKVEEATDKMGGKVEELGDKAAESTN